MGNLKEVRKRIVSVKSTQQITKAMKLVAASKLRRAQDAILKIRPYSEKINKIISGLTEHLGDSNAKNLFEEREIEKVLLVVVTTDKGLCGAFNANVIKLTEKKIKKEYNIPYSNDKLDIMTIGSKNYDYFKKRNYNVLEDGLNFFSNLNFDNVEPVVDKIIKKFSAKEYDRIDVIFNSFKNAAVYITSSRRFLPVDSIKEETQEKQEKNDYIFEPDEIMILDNIVPWSLKIDFYRMLLDSFASEHGARMTAMEQATDNSENLLSELKLKYNKERQAAITNEILEIVSGAEALKK